MRQEQQSGVSWLPAGVTWKYKGVTWAVAFVAMVGAMLPIIDGNDDPTPAIGSGTNTQLKLLESTWEDASTLESSDSLSTAVAQDTVADAGAQLDMTVAELEQAPAANLGLAAADAVLTDAIVDADAAISSAETALTGPVSATDKAQIAAAEQKLDAALEQADAVTAAAVVDADISLLNTLEQTDAALADASSTLAAVQEPDASWVTKLNGWVPKLRYAVDRRGPKDVLTGAGIDIAVIDSGVTPVQGLNGPGKVINGPDLSTDGANPALKNLDLYGHGTHLAGIIAGKDTTDSATPFRGIAPDARIVNVKVADAEGNTSIEQIVAAIEWVVLNRKANGMNIRVMNLSLGYDMVNYQSDPIAAALEAAWEAGIVVVVAGGNKGVSAPSLDSPAIDPYVISVAASDQGDPLNRTDDVVAPFSSSGSSQRSPDVTAPGKSIVSLRVPGSYADVHYPQSKVSERFAVASGTSQAAAVASGTFALLLARAPQLTPDQVKVLFTNGAVNLQPGTIRDGKGRIELGKATWLYKIKKAGADRQQFHPRSVVPAGFGTINGGWKGGTWSGATWSGGTWSGATWSGATWSGATWSGATWSGATWSGATWSGATWSGATWSGATWSGATWS